MAFSNLLKQSDIFKSIYQSKITQNVVFTPERHNTIGVHLFWQILHRENMWHANLT